METSLYAKQMSKSIIPFQPDILCTKYVDKGFFSNSIYLIYVKADDS